MHHRKHLAHLLLPTGCWAIPGSCGELLLQRLDVSKLDSLSSASGSDHITLKEKRDKTCPVKELFEERKKKDSPKVTLISLVSISPSDATSWCVSTYLSHLDRTFSLGADTWMALGITGCRTVPRSMLKEGLWSTHFSPPAERERRCSGRTGADVCRRDKPSRSTGEMRP